MLILGPRAVQRFATYTPTWPIPKLYRLRDKAGLNAGIFEGAVINTVSMMCVEDHLDALRWADRAGGVDALVALSMKNLGVVEAFVAEHSWVSFLAETPETRSNTSVCLTLPGATAAQVKQLCSLLDKEGVAFDIGSYRDAPPGLRIWCGATVQADDLQCLMQWVAWAHATVLGGC